MTKDLPEAVAVAVVAVVVAVAVRGDVAVAAVAVVAMAGHKPVRPVATTIATSEGDSATRSTARDKRIHSANVWLKRPYVHFPSDGYSLKSHDQCSIA